MLGVTKRNSQKGCILLVKVSGHAPPAKPLVDLGNITTAENSVVDEITFFNFPWSQVESIVLFGRTPMAKVAIRRLWVHHGSW